MCHVGAWDVKFFGHHLVDGHQIVCQLLDIFMTRNLMVIAQR